MPTPRADILHWPSWLEPSLVDGYSLDIADRRQSSDFDIGSQLRVLYDTDEATVGCALYLDSLGSNWFESFERDLLKQGSRWFYMPLWIGGQMVDHLVRFKTRPTLSDREAVSEHSVYTFQLEVGRREGLMDKEWAEWLIDNDPYKLIRLLDRLQTVINDTLPKVIRG